MIEKKAVYNLTAEEAAEIVRKQWAAEVVPVQAVLKERYEEYKKALTGQG